jgi:hypothetical protein
MALVQLVDVIEPEVYGDYTAEDSPEKTAFYESGVITRNELLDQKANTGGRIIELPFWKDLDASQEPNRSDDTTNDATPQKIEADSQKARIAYVNQGYSAADLAGEIAGSDPMQRVRNRFGTYWMRQWQRRLIAAAQGILADNIANDGGDMVFAAGDVFTRAAFVEAAFTLGDNVSVVRTIGVHSGVFKQMVDNDDIEFIEDSQGELTIPTYMGKRVVVDDGLPAVSAGGNITYTSILFGEGAFGYGEGSPKMPVELERDASKGNGGGIETLWERKTWLLHPFGFDFLSTTVTGGVTPSLANLRLAANWNRVVYRKNVPLAFLTSTETTPTT